MSALPEVPMAQATGETLAVYRKLMTAAGSGSPALIFRHMATYPGLLGWLWRAVGRDVESGWPCRAVWDIVARQPKVPLAPFPAGDLAAWGVDPGVKATIGHMLTSYNRMNPVNLVAVGAARALIAGEELPVTETFSKAAAAPPAPPPDLPPPLAMAGLPPDLRQAIDGICRTIPRVDTDVTPTMYRHFAHWPAFMAAVAERIDAKLPDIDRATHALAADCRPLMAALKARAGRDIGPPPVADPAPLLKVLDTFSGYVIPHMVVIGEALEAALAE